MTRHLINYSTLPCSTIQSQIKLTMNPWFVTGLTDGEGTFTVSIYKSKDRKTEWRIQPSFSIELHKKDLTLLNRIQSFFSAGTIRIREKNGQGGIYSVNDLKELTNVIIPHFDKYTLLTQKRADFELFKKIVIMMCNKEHLASEGLTKIISIRASMNKGLSETLLTNFPDIIPVVRPLVESMEIPDCNWLAGFTEADGCFYVSVVKSKTTTGFTVQLKFQLTQHSRDKQLMEYLITYLECGRYEARSKNAQAGNFVVSKLSDITKKIIPFFDKYPIIGSKSKDFADFKLVSKLIENKAHLTAEGLDQIKKIKERMNTGRKEE